MTTVEDLDAWLLRALPGGRCVYHVGEWVYDLEVGQAARAASEAGQVTLVQQRLGPSPKIRALGDGSEYRPSKKERAAMPQLPIFRYEAVRR